MAEVEVKMEVGSDGVAVITISSPPVNAFVGSIIAIAWLKEKFDEAMSRNDVKAIVLTGKHGKFSGGFDINVFQKVQQSGNLSLLPEMSIDLVVNRIEDAKKPIVAAIEGLALGAGLEVAMGCHARIAAPKAHLGLPELSLGVILGAGGTQRLPRLLGLPKALDMMLTSKPILFEEGHALGLIDAIVHPQELIKVSRQWALDIANTRKPWVRSLHRTDRIGSLSESYEILKFTREQTASPNMPQNQACLDVIKEGIVHGGYPGVLKVCLAVFLLPAHVMPLLEIVRTEKTSAQVILDLMTLGKIIKKIPVVVGNCTGFAVNRAFFPYKQSAHILLLLGVDLFRIDRLIRSFGLPMGPFQLEDLTGYGVAVASAKEFSSAFPDRTFVSPIVDLLTSNGRNGKNNGKGYYLYEKGSKPKPDPHVLPIIEESRKLANLMPEGKTVSMSDQEIVEMVLFPVVNEACRVLEEGIVVRASDLDVASILGMGFPSYRGGIVFWADVVGSKYIYTSLKKWSGKYGNFYKPSRFLEERAISGVPLSEPVLEATNTGSRARL